MNIQKIKSDLVMEELFFPECTVSRAATIASEHIDVDVNKKIVQTDAIRFEVTVTVDITKASSDLNVHVVAKATFLFDAADQTLVKQVIETNTVAIMFPFIRSQVSLLTTQPGLTPIVLPPINTARFN